MEKPRIWLLVSRCFKGLWPKKKQPINKPKRKKVDNEAIRARIKAQGWNLLEVPIKKTDPKTKQISVARWKIVATKGAKSLEVGGSNIDEALKNIGVTLGVISKEN
jgi:hypothetical protein